MKKSIPHFGSARPVATMMELMAGAAAAAKPADAAAKRKASLTPPLALPAQPPQAPGGPRVVCAGFPPLLCAAAHP